MGVAGLVEGTDNGQGLAWLRGQIMGVAGLVEGTDNGWVWPG